MVGMTGYSWPIHVQCFGKHSNSLQDLYEMAREQVKHGQNTMALFLCAANNTCNLNPAQINELCEQVFAYRNSICEAAHTLKDIDPIPADYATNDTHWPPHDQSV